MNKSCSTIIIVLAFFSFLGQQVYAQNQEKVKKEREKKIKERDFPQEGLDQLKIIFKSFSKLKFFEETQDSSLYYEAKGKILKDQLSIKFTESGVLYDIEILTEFKDLPRKVRTTIESYLKENYKKYKVRKIQIQYSPKRENSKSVQSLQDFSLGKIENFAIKYELIAETLSADKERRFYEFLFDANGNLEVKRRISTREDDIILY